MTRERRASRATLTAAPAMGWVAAVTNGASVGQKIAQTVPAIAGGVVRQGYLAVTAIAISVMKLA